jgi:hypothetical protein
VLDGMLMRERGEMREVSIRRRERFILGCTHCDAWMYSSTLGRFLTTDPVGHDNLSAQCHESHGEARGHVFFDGKRDPAHMPTSPIPYR